MARPILRVQLLGDFNLLYGGEIAPGLNKPRLQSLLAYLILHADVAVSRQHLAFVLWPDTPESQARNNLRQLLHQLRRSLPEPDRLLSIDTQTVSWRLAPEQSIDLLLFERALAEASDRRTAATAVQPLLEDALSNYAGDLLPACYDDWIVPERDRLRQQRYQALQKLATLLEEKREYPAAVQQAQLRLRLDPLDEQNYILLMRLHSLNHDRQGVRRVYQSAVDTFERELGVVPDEGLRQAFEHWQRTAAAPAPPAAEQGAAALTLVGRQAEWQLLQELWQQVANRGAQLVLVTGEAGIGKSRLAEELFHWARRQGATAAHTRCYAAEGRLSLAPVTDWLRSDALRSHWLGLDNFWLTEVARLLPELLAERADLARPGPISEYGMRQRFFEALARAMLTAPHALLLWIDDLQWCDPETLEWLHFLLRFRAQSPLLVVGTARSDELPSDHPLSGLTRQLRTEGRLVSVELAALDAAETAKLAAEIKGRDLDLADSLHLFHETEGNPLFVVETVRAALGGPPGEAIIAPPGSAASQSHTLPPRVYALIAGRLAQLSPSARKVAELGAAIGRTFSLDLLRRAGNEDEVSVIDALDELWQKQIVRELSANQFDFTHDKLREVAYAQIGRPQCRQLHRRIAEALEALNAQNLDTVSTQIAAHYEQAGLFGKALPYYQRAASAAADVYANDSAIDLFTRALALLAEFPVGAARDTQELVIQLALSPLYRITKGWASPEVERGLNHALELSNRVGDVAQRAQTLYGLQSLHVVAARLPQVEEIYTEMHRLFIETQGHPPPPFAGLMHAGAQLHMGQANDAREQFERIVAVRDDRHIRDLQASQGVNYLAHGNAWNSHALWYLGYPYAALAAGTAAVQFATEYVQPFNRALAVTYLAMLQELRADRITFQANAEEALTVSQEYQAPYYYAWANILVHFAEAWQDPGAESLVRLQGAIKAFTETGARLRLPYFLSLLARASYKAGRLEAAHAAVTQAFDESRRNHERWWDADLHRLRGEVLAAQGAPAPEIEGAFRQALAIAQTQQARSLELRAATALARWWHAQGRSAEAHELLAPVYGWFSEGFDTLDLQAAQTLISELQTAPIPPKSHPK